LAPKTVGFRLSFPHPISTKKYIPTIPTRMAVTINLRMVKSFNRSIPSCLSYLNACPFWRKKPKKIPVMSPRIRVSILFTPFPVEETSHDDTPNEEADKGDPTAYG
jgi:hypothetical protein